VRVVGNLVVGVRVVGNVVVGVRVVGDVVVGVRVVGGVVHLRQMSSSSATAVSEAIMHGMSVEPCMCTHIIISALSAALACCSDGEVRRSYHVISRCTGPGSGSGNVLNNRGRPGDTLRAARGPLRHRCSCSRGCALLRRRAGGIRSGSYGGGSSSCPPAVRADSLRRHRGCSLLRLVDDRRRRWHRICRRGDVRRVRRCGFTCLSFKVSDQPVAHTRHGQRAKCFKLVLVSKHRPVC